MSGTLGVPAACRSRPVLEGNPCPLQRHTAPVLTPSSLPGSPQGVDVWGCPCSQPETGTSCQQQPPLRVTHAGKWTQLSANPPQTSSGRCTSADPKLLRTLKLHRPHSTAAPPSGPGWLLPEWEARQSLSTLCREQRRGLQGLAGGPGDQVCLGTSGSVKHHAQETHCSAWNSGPGPGSRAPLPSRDPQSPGTNLPQRGNSQAASQVTCHLTSPAQAAHSTQHHCPGLWRPHAPH